MKTSIDTIELHKQQLDDLPTMTGHIQHNIQTMQAIDANMQTIAPTIQQHIRNIRKNAQDLASQKAKLNGLVSNQTKLTDRIEDIEDDMEPNTLWNMLKGASDITANAFTIANNARQIAESTQSTMLKNVADMTSTIQSVTNSMKDITDTVTNITNTVNELKRTYANFFKDTTHHKPTPTEDEITPTENDTQQTPILTDILNIIDTMKQDIIENEGGFTLT